MHSSGLSLPSQNPVSDAYSVLWFVFQPLLFGLIGAEIRVSALRADTVGLGLLVLSIGEDGVRGTGGGVTRCRGRRGRGPRGCC